MTVEDRRVTVYAGSFDPITNGHLDLLDRGLKIFDNIIVAVAENPAKKPLLSLQERLELIRSSLVNHPEPHRIQIDSFKGLLVDYVERCGAVAILRGLRAVSDFEYEFQTALMNRKLNREVQSIFLMTDYKWFYTSSTIIKEAASFNGDVSGLVPELVNQKLKQKFGY